MRAEKRWLNFVIVHRNYEYGIVNLKKKKLFSLNEVFKLFFLPKNSRPRNAFAFGNIDIEI